jgi:ubiquinone/menaquinone biosynthesis C-methylase UbiE
LNHGYYLPADEAEARRLDAMQFIFRTIFHRNILPSISVPPSLIIDVGTGPGSCQCLGESAYGTVGRWAIEVAEENPSARVVGIDLAPVQPETIPSNCEFVIGDAIVELPEFHDCSADLINSRSETYNVQSSSQD